MTCNIMIKINIPANKVFNLTVKATTGNNFKVKGTSRCFNTKNHNFSYGKVISNTYQSLET